MSVKTNSLLSIKLGDRIRDEDKRKLLLKKLPVMKEIVTESISKKIYIDDIPTKKVRRKK